MNPRPCSSQMAIARMASLIGVMMPYVYGTGDFLSADPLNPWTTRAKDGKKGSDCAGAAMSFAFMIPRHRPGYNHGSWATVSDDLNTNSAIEDAEHAQDLWTRVDGDDVEPGDVVCYPTIHLPGHPLPWIGHVQLIYRVPPGYRRSMGYAPLRVYQCCGPDFRMPAIIESDAHAMDIHDNTWGGVDAHRVKILRIKP